MRRRAARNAGFSYAEVLVAIVVLGIVAAGLAQGLALTSAGLGGARVESVATNLAVAQLEEVQRLKYPEVGTVGGNPPGTIPALQDRTVRGIAFEVRTTVTYVSDPALGQPVTNLDYKRVAVTVTPGGDDARRAVTQTTFVAPPNYVAIAGKATVIAEVVDPFADPPRSPLAGVSVTVSGSTSPSATGTTGTNGELLVPGLEPSATNPSSPTHEYRVGAEREGYAVLTPESELRKNLVASQTWSPVLEMFKPATIVVNLRDAVTGEPVAEPATVGVVGPSPDQRRADGSGATGTFTFTQLDGRPIEPSASDTTVSVVAECHETPPPLAGPVPASYPSQTTAVFDVPLEATPHGDLAVTVVDHATGAPIAGAEVVVSGDDVPAPAARAADAAGAHRRCLPPSGDSPYRVSVAVPGYGVASLPAGVALGATTPLELRAVAGQTGGLVFQHDDPDRLVRLQSVAGSYDVTERTDGSGSVHFGDLAAGDYLVSFDAAAAPPPAFGPPVEVVVVASENRAYQLG